MTLLSKLLQEDPDDIDLNALEISPEQRQFLNALLTIRLSSKINDFYIFNNIITALNYEFPDFAEFYPVSSEEMWNGIHIIHKIFPDFKFGGEVVIYIKKILNEDGVYFYPKFIDPTDIIMDVVVEKSKKGPFPLGDEDTLDLQASKFLVLNTYHEIQLTKDFGWLING